MSDLVPEQDKTVIDVSDVCYDEIRCGLIAHGGVVGGPFMIDRGSLGRVIDAGGFVIRNGYKEQK